MRLSCLPSGSLRDASKLLSPLVRLRSWTSPLTLVFQTRDVWDVDLGMEGYFDV